MIEKEYTLSTGNKKAIEEVLFDENLDINAFIYEALSDKVVEAVKSGAIKKFFVTAGCGGRV